MRNLPRASQVGKTAICPQLYFFLTHPIHILPSLTVYIWRHQTLTLSVIAHAADNPARFGHFTSAPNLNASLSRVLPRKGTTFLIQQS